MLVFKFVVEVLLFGFAFRVLCVVSQYTSLTPNAQWNDDLATDSYGWSPTNIYDSYIHGFWATNDASVLTRIFVLPQENNGIYNITVNFSIVAGATWDTPDRVRYSIELGDGTVFASGVTATIHLNQGTQNGWVVSSNPYTEVASYNWYGTYDVTSESVFDPNEFASSNLVLKFYSDPQDSGQNIDDEFWGVHTISIQVDECMRHICLSIHY